MVMNFKEYLKEISPNDNIGIRKDIEDSRAYKHIINAADRFASLKTKELEKQLQKEAIEQLSLLDQIKELEDKNKWLKNKLETIILTISEDYDTEKEMNGEIEFVDDTLTYLNEQLDIINTK